MTTENAIKPIIDKMIGIKSICDMPYGTPEAEDARERQFQANVKAFKAWAKRMRGNDDDEESDE